MLIADCPIVQGFVRKEFLYDEEQGHGEFVKAVIFGVRAEPARAPMFQVMLESGAQWARVPIDKICLRHCAPLPIGQLVWWDCYGYDFAVHQFSFLKNHKVTALGRDGEIRTGNYLFTIDWMRTGWSEIPDQHKNHHVIGLQAGQLIAYPNNRLLWEDPSWITPALDKNWKSPTRTVFVEGST